MGHVSCPLDSDRGGSRTHTHQALNLIALPVSVPGQYQVAGQGVEPSCKDYEPSPDAGPPAVKVADPGIEPGRRPYESPLGTRPPAKCSDQGESRTPTPLRGPAF